MVYRITSDCVACGGCSVVCPMDAIDDGFYPKPNNRNLDSDRFVELEHYSINYNCDQCGQCQEVCPTGAIVYD